MRLDPLRLRHRPALLLVVSLLACGEASYDLVISGGLVVDGTGARAVAEDVAIRGDRIVARGRLAGAPAVRTLDAAGRVVAPGFVDLLGHSALDLLVDPRAESKIRQGITTEINGEGRSVAPQNARTRREHAQFAETHGIAVDWSDLDGYLRRLTERGSALNVGSYVGATQLRKVVIGRDDRPASAAELVRMRRLVTEAMAQGAFGLSSALVYAPGSYASTDELAVLAGEAAAHGGLYATHLRGEGPRIFGALAEAFEIARRAATAVEIFHLKAAGPEMRGRMGEIAAEIEAARASGLDVSADVYPYTAAYTSLSATLPPWVHDGGGVALLDRLRDAATRARILAEIERPGEDWENFYRLAGGAGGIQIAAVGSPKLRPYRGLRLSEVAGRWKLGPREALLELLLADRASTGALYFVSHEEDVEHALALPWVHVATDAAARSEGPLYESSLHPRAYGSYPRVLGRYVRERSVLALEEAVRKMTSAPARRVDLRERGELRVGYYADVVVFDPERVGDLATYEEPTHYSTGIEDVVVNGELVLADGHMTGAHPGRALRGPGWKPGGDEGAVGNPASAPPRCDNDAVPGGRPLWVVVAHPEDATLGFAGPIFEARRAGRPVRVVVLTDGADDCDACDLWKRGDVASAEERERGCTARELAVFGHLRRREALAALELLGVPEGDVTFLGHTAGTLRDAWADPAGTPRQPACLRERSGRARAEPASGERLLRRLGALVDGIEDDALLLTSHPYDADPDHGATYELVRTAKAGAHQGREVYLAVLRDNRDAPCLYPNPAAARCERPSGAELAASPGLLAELRNRRHAPDTWWAAPSDVDYGTPLYFCLADELYREPDALKRRAIERLETHIGLRQRRGQPLPPSLRGWADFSGRLLGFVHRNELLYRDRGRFLRGGSRAAAEAR